MTHRIVQKPLNSGNRAIAGRIPSHRFRDLVELCKADDHSQSFMVKCGIAMAMIITKEQRIAVVEEFELKE